jgi:DNA-binding response OmpR family regulator
MVSKRRILVIEDDPHVLIFVTDTLEFLGYEVLVARNGREGLETAKKEKAELIILDIMMPEMDGYEVCRRFKSDTKTKHLPILMLSAKGQIKDKIKGLDIGADDYLTKPYDKEEFESRVKALIRRLPNKDDEPAITTVPTLDGQIQDRIKELDRGADVYLTKSYDKEEFECRVKEVIRRTPNQNDELVMTTVPTLFLSYAHADADQVEKIYKALSRQGYNPWMDVHDISPGEDWSHAINTAIDKSEFFVPILSKNSVNRRGMIVKEMQRALDKWRGMLPDDIYIIPIRIDGCPFPELIHHLQVLDWNAGKGQNKLFEAISVAMRRRIQR